ncbi:MAG: DNA polymerase III subunit alpha [Waddliaceae bacterium]
MFIPLHVHSQYSILDASASIQGIVDKAKAFDMPAVALTDHGNMFGAVEFFKSAQKAGIKPIVGCELYIAPRSRLEKKKERGERAAFHQTILAKNMQGYQNLCKLSSIGYLDGFYYFPRIDFEMLEKHSEGLICLSGCLSSRLSHEILHGNPSDVKELIAWYQKVFGDDFYLEVQRHRMSEENLKADGFTQETWLLQQYQERIDQQERVNEALVQLSKEFGIPLVATNDSHYIERDEWKAHEILLNIQSGEPCEIWEKDRQGNPKFRVPNPKRRTYASNEVYFKSPEEMASLFSDLPEAIENTVKVAEKCELIIDLKTKHYPVFIPPALEGKEVVEEQRSKAVEHYLWELCEEGIPKRYTQERLDKVAELFPDQDPMQVVRNRLQHEMDVIAPKGMCDYLLIVWDFIHWAKKNGIPMGPGRGSGAGSIVLYLIGVTDIEPLRFNLFFERFINPERLSYPDIDVDICMDRRSEVINYTLSKYGKENLAQIITFGTMKAKMVLRDVGRVLSVPLSKVNAIAKLVPDDLNITLEKAIEKDHEFRSMYENDEDAARLIDLGKKLEGSIRNTGIHAAGIIISGQPLTELIPVCVAKDAQMPVTQYSMKPVEQVGMLKMDFLGLKTLTAIDLCTRAVAEKTGEVIHWTELSLEDTATFELLNKGKTLGIFQLESGGMQDLARNLHLDRFEEIIAVTSLYRPGPMDMIPSFINRKHGKESIEYDHPWLEEILSETYGIMVYQEQVMQIAQKLAGYSLGEGDVLRRAMGKKDMAQMSKEREKFRTGAIENGIDEQTAMVIFDKMEKFAAYGFNKSHAAAYGYLSYVTAFFKANYPAQWMAALMTCDSQDISKVAKFIRECKPMGIALLPPDINESGDRFMATDKGIRFALSAIKGVGEGIVESILLERKNGGHFTDLYDFLSRINTQKVGKKMVECLVLAGCFDFTDWSRDQLKISIEPMFEAAVKEKKEKSAGVLNLFDLMGETTSNRFEKPPEVKIPYSKQELLLKEKELLGFFVTGHPMDQYKEILGRLSCLPLRRLEELEHQTVFRSAFIVESVQTRFSSKTNKKFAILMISDGIATYELPIWANLFEEKKALLLENQMLYAVLIVDKEQEQTRLSCEWLEDLTEASEAMVAECDQAYDRAKKKVLHFAKRKQFASKKPKEPVQEEQEKKISKYALKVDLNALYMSQILKIKDLLQDYPGEIPFQVDFMKEGQEFAHLQLDLSVSPKIKDQLKKIGTFEEIAS